MTGMLDLSPRAAFLGVKRVDDEGAIRGLEEHRGREFLLMRLPAVEGPVVEDLRRGWSDAAGQLADQAEAWRRGAEDEAERMARRLDLDPRDARKAVHVATGWVDVLRAAAAAPAVAKEAAEEHEAIMQAGAAAQEGATGWAPRPEPPEAASPGSTFVSADRVWEERAREAGAEARDVGRSIRGGISAMTTRHEEAAERATRAGREGQGTGAVAGAGQPQAGEAGAHERSSGQGKAAGTDPQGKGARQGTRSWEPGAGGP